jgi:hypothetical protein
VGGVSQGSINTVGVMQPWAILFHPFRMVIVRGVIAINNGIAARYFLDQII